MFTLKWDEPYGDSTSRDTSKQVTVQMTYASRILQMQAHAGTVETCNMAHILHLGGQQLWHEICQQRRCQSFDSMPREKV